LSLLIRRDEFILEEFYKKLFERRNIYVRKNHETNGKKKYSKASASDQPNHYLSSVGDFLQFVWKLKKI